MVGNRRRYTCMQKTGRTLLIIIVAGVIFVGQRWYDYVTNKTSPYD